MKRRFVKSSGTLKDRSSVALDCTKYISQVYRYPQNTPLNSPNKNITKKERSRGLSKLNSSNQSNKSWIHGSCRQNMAKNRRDRSGSARNAIYHDRIYTGNERQRSLMSRFRPTVVGGVCGAHSSTDVCVLSSHLFWTSDLWTHQPGSHRRKVVCIHVCLDVFTVVYADDKKRPQIVGKESLTISRKDCGMFILLCLLCTRNKYQLQQVLPVALFQRSVVTETRHT